MRAGVRRRLADKMPIRTVIVRTVQFDPAWMPNRSNDRPRGRPDRRWHVGLVVFGRLGSDERNELPSLSAISRTHADHSTLLAIGLGCRQEHRQVVFAVDLIIRACSKPFL